MFHGKPEACRRSVVKDIDREMIETNDFSETLNDARDIVERVTEIVAGRHVGLAEAGKIRRDQVKPVGQQRDQVAEHMACTRKTVQQ